MDVFDAVHGRRTWKSFQGDPLTRAELEELFELARWAPNHKLTEPWRFRVIGPRTRAELRQITIDQAKDKAPDGADAEKVVAAAVRKFERSPTIVAVSTVRNPDPKADSEDCASSSVAAYLVLLAAHARGFAAFWRSPKVLQSAEGSAAVGIGPGEEPLGMIHLGRPGEVHPKPGKRKELEHFVSWLD